MGFIMGFETCGLWFRLQLHQRQESPQPGPGIHFAPNSAAAFRRTEPELRRRADDVVRNRSPRWGSSRLTPRSRNGHRAGPTDTPDFSPAHLSCGRPTWCPVTVPHSGRPVDPRRPTSQGPGNRRSAPRRVCHRLRATAPHGMFGASCPRGAMNAPAVTTRERTRRTAPWPSSDARRRLRRSSGWRGRRSRGGPDRSRWCG